MTALPWWAWVAVVVAVLFLFMRGARRGFRRNVRRAFADWLKEQSPPYTIVAEHEDRLEVTRGEDDQESISLHKVYGGCAAAGATTPEAMRPVFERFLRAIRELDDLRNRALRLDEDGDRILPRLVRPEFLASLPRDAKLPTSDLAPTGLMVVYVIDAPESVLYLTEQHQQELGLELDALHERALENLSHRFPRDAVRQIVDENAFALIKAMDSFDAARLLLVPRYLEPGEKLGAAIPDRDTLALAPHAAGREAIAKLAKTPDGEHLLLDRPLVVTSEGFELL